ncbi:hypothetical protein CEXT_488861 [Caerostris extrusa]|uniref:Uncharacterized protein n=1 Tax=Caerostris extrusa TaxID=172846 RepID=A0AAV4UNP0_CAEEX|nr:hypothetical protein CEXT_488861 [Caerostris extrusa]
MGQVQTVIPQIPEVKLPICVIANNLTVLKVLNKMKIDVGDYYMEPPEELQSTISKEDGYTDFTAKQIDEISANFIYSSFFSSGPGKKESLQPYGVEVCRFLYRISNVQHCKSFVFFMHMASCEEFNKDILSNVLKLLEDWSFGPLSD